MLTDIDDVLGLAEKNGASDLHLTVGVPPVIRIDGELEVVDAPVMSPQDTERLAEQLLGDRYKEFARKGEVDLSYSVAGQGRYRINVYRQRDSVALAARMIPHEIPTVDSLGLPDIIAQLARREQGLVVVTGPTGSGKSTTLAAMIRLINEERRCHVITLEDPIEYLHNHQRSVVDQREVGSDTASFAAGLRSALRQDPDVVLVGEMRDQETMDIGLRAAETGHLVLTTLHTRRATAVVNRIVSSFPPGQQSQIRMQLAGTLEGAVAQRLLPRIGGGRVAVMEVMVGTSAVRNLIREGKSHQLASTMQTGARHGMLTLQNHLQQLIGNGIVSRQEAEELIQEMDVEGF